MIEYKFNQVYSVIQQLPKIELHLHLDGSLSPEFIAKQAMARNIKLPCNKDHLRTWLHEQKLAYKVEKDNAVAVGKNWPIFDFCNQFLQTKSELKEATQDLLSRLAAENIVYAEIRFCPELHILEGLTLNETVEAVIDGFREQESVIGGIIICALRSKSSQHGILMAELAAKYLQHSSEKAVGVVGFDVAGAEGNYPLASNNDSMVSAVKRAQELKVPVTIHAGEYPENYNTIANIDYAVSNLKVQRLGHAIVLRSASDDLWQKVIDSGICIEVCLTSNIGNGFKVSSYDKHPVREFYKRGIPFSLSCDNLLLSGDVTHNCTPCGEIQCLVNDVGLDWLAVKFSILCGARAAFSPNVTELWIEALAQRIDKCLSALL